MVDLGCILMKERAGMLSGESLVLRRNSSISLQGFMGGALFRNDFGATSTVFNYSW